MAVTRRGLVAPPLPALTRPLLHPRARVFAAAIIGVAIAAAAFLAPPANSASPPTPEPAAGTGATPVVSRSSSPPLSLLLPNRTAQLIWAAILTLAVLPIAALSLRAAAWYWALLAGPAADFFLLIAGPPRTPIVVDWIAMPSVWLAPLLALRGLRRRQLAPSLGGERWATPQDLRVHQLKTWPEPAPHLSAGTWGRAVRESTSQPTVYGLDADREGRHTLLVVPTGLGKGLWTVTQLLTWNGGAIVNDLKGDTFPRTAGCRRTLGPVYVLSGAAPIHRFDPTAQARTEEDLRPLAHAVCDDPEDRTYWAQHAERILLVLMLAATQAREPVFPFVARAIRSGATRALAMAAEVDPILADRIRSESRNTFASAWETLATRCESILSPYAVATLSGSDLTPADLLRERATLYLQIPEARLADLRPFLRLVWTSLMQQLATASDRAHQAHHPLLLILDEAGRTPFAELPDFLVTLRSRRISCAVLVQALSQLRAAYGQQANTILGNCTVHVYARSEDLATAEYISERLGMAEELVPTESRSTGPAGQSVTRGQLRRFRPLFTPQEVRRMQDHHIVTFLPACPPALLTRMDWRSYPALVQRSEIRPPEITPLEIVPPSPPPRIATEYVEPE